MRLRQQLIYLLLLFGGKPICSNGQFKIQSNFYNALIHANNALMPPNRHALIHPKRVSGQSLKPEEKSLKPEMELDDPPIITQPLPNKNDRDFEPLSGITVKGPCQWEIQTSYNPTRIPTQITEVICTGTGTSCEQNHPMYQVLPIFVSFHYTFVFIKILIENYKYLVYTKKIMIPSLGSIKPIVFYFLESILR